jgi:hypothetical protein
MQNSKLDRTEEKNSLDWENSIKEAKVHIVLQCHRRRSFILLTAVLWSHATIKGRELQLMFGEQQSFQV